MSSREIDVKWVKTRNGYSWKQTRNEVYISFEAPEGTRGRDVVVDSAIKRLKAGLRSSPPLLDGELFSQIIPDETLWTLEDGVVEIVLVKAKHHESWKSVLAGQDEVDPFTQEEMNKKMMLEKFQAEHPGFDFSGAEFSGSVPEDPANFGRFD